MYLEIIDHGDAGKHSFVGVEIDFRQSRGAGGDLHHLRLHSSLGSLKDDKERVIREGDDCNGPILALFP